MGLSDRSFFLTPLAGILLLAIVLRGVFLVSYSHRPVSDEVEYLNLARTLSETGEYLHDGIPTAYRPVGYPAFLAVLMVVGIESPQSLRVIQTILDMSIVVGLYLLGRRHGRREGYLAAFLWAIFTPAIIYTGLLLSETLAVTLMVWFNVLLLNKSLLNRPPFAFMCGCTGGFLALVKPWLLLFFLPATAYLVSRPIDRRSIVLFAAGILFFVLPWMTRNFLALDTPALSTNMGANLYIGNNPDATGAYKAVFPQDLIHGSMNPDEFSQRAGDRAREYIISNPGTFLVNAIKKVAHTLRGEGELLVWAFHGDMRNPHTTFSEKYRSLPPWIVAAGNIPYWLAVLLGTLGMVRFWKDDFGIIVLALTIVLFLVHTVFFGGGRFHFLLMPFFVLASARIVPGVHDHWKTLSPRRRILMMIVTSILVALWSYELILVY